MRRGVTVLSAGAGALLAGCASTTSPCRDLTGAEPRLSSAGGRTFIAGYDYADDASRVRHLHCRAAQGAQDAELELARRYEEGEGVAADPAKAAALYARAAASAPVAAAIYMPPARIGGSGRVLRVDNPSTRNGLPEARFRLGRMLLDGRGVEPDPRRGRAMIEEAARGGHDEAQRWLHSAEPAEQSDERKR